MTDAPTFTPTSDWQDVPDGAICPPGLHYQVDPNTGLKRARLAPNGDPTEPTGAAWKAACIEPNWLVYRLAPRNDGSGKLDKWPANPRTGKAPITVYAAATLAFAEAQEAAARLGVGYGIGYLPRAGSALIGIDLDKVISDGTIEPWARRFLDLGSSWAERSPSGTGIRIVGARKHSGAPDITSEKNGVGLYAADKRFFTFTGDLIEGRKSFVCSIPAVVKATLGRLNGAAHSAADFLSKPEPDADTPHWFDQLPEERQDEEVERMLGRLTDPKFGEYDLWLRISMAVYAATDSMARDVWDRWCQKLPGYDADENNKKWDTFGRATGPVVGVGTLIMLAREHGYEPPSITMDPEIAERIAALADRFKADTASIPSQPKEQEADWQEGGSLAALMAATFPEPRWALPGLIPEGLAVFAGKQKSGKSWWCLSLAHAVAERGEFLGKPGGGGDVLLLALEDNPRRLKSRVRKMGLSPSARVSICTSWPTGQPGLRKLLEWIAQAPDPILIIIDTLRRFTGPSSSRENSYERDVTLFSPLQKAAALARVAVVGVTHMRKDTRHLDHWQDAITGSAGLPSVADAVLLLTREAGGVGAILRATGRDLAEVEIPLSFDKQTCTWQTTAQTIGAMLARIEGNAAERRLLAALEQFAQPTNAKTLAHSLGRTVQAVRHVLRKLHQENAVEKTENGTEALWSIK